MPEITSRQYPCGCFFHQEESGGRRHRVSNHCNIHSSWHQAEVIRLEEILDEATTLLAENPNGSKELASFFDRRRGLYDKLGILEKL